MYLCTRILFSRRNRLGDLNSNPAVPRWWIGKRASDMKVSCEYVNVLFYKQYRTKIRVDFWQDLVLCSHPCRVTQMCMEWQPHILFSHRKKI